MYWPGPDLAAAGLDFLDLDDVGVGVELHIVEDAHRRHDEAHLDRERAAQRLDLLGQAVGAIWRVDQRQQRIAELDLEVVDLERGRDRFVRGLGLGGGFGFLRLGGGGHLRALVDDVGERAGAAAERQERHHRNAGQKRHHQHHRARHAERLGIAGELLSSALSAAPATPALETSRPAAVETISAGTCVTRPSPTVSSV